MNANVTQTQTQTQIPNINFKIINAMNATIGQILFTDSMHICLPKNTYVTLELFRKTPMFLNAKLATTLQLLKTDSEFTTIPTNTNKTLSLTLMLIHSFKPY